MNTPAEIALSEKIARLKKKPPIRPQTERALSEHLFGKHVVVAVVATRCSMGLMVLHRLADWMALSNATRPRRGYTAEVIGLYPSTMRGVRHLMNA